MNRIKLWTGMGACLLIPALPAVAGAAAPLALLSQAGLSADATQSGEGGEAGGLIPSNYQLMLDEEAAPHYDARAVRDNYRQLAQSGYDQALAALATLQQAVDRLLKQPDVPHLVKARQAWIAAHRAYLRTEPLRFYDGPIDGAGDALMPAGPEARINAWPLNEAVIDYVEGARDSGLVNDFDVPITRETLLSRDQVSDEADVTTGYHAIEFLLWGQDRSSTGPGNRPSSDFDADTIAGKRRATYLRELLALLHDDLSAVRAQWNPKTENSYASRLDQMDDFEVVGRMLHGLTALTAMELSSERLAVALDSATQEDETNCFSDSSTAALQASLEGVANFYRGGTPRASLSALVRKQDRAADQAVLAALKQAQAAAARLPAALDQVLLSAPDDPRRAQAEALVIDLQKLASTLKAAGRAVGVLVPVAGV